MGYDSNIIEYSETGQTWHIGGENGESFRWMSAWYGGDRFVAVGENESTVGYSDDGIS